MIQLVKVSHFLIFNGGTANHSLMYFVIMRPRHLRGVNKVASIICRWSKGEALQVQTWARICFYRHVPLMDTTPRQTWLWRKWKAFGLGAAVTLLPVPMTELLFPKEVSKEAQRARCASFLPLSPFGLSSSFCGRVTHTMLLFWLQLTWGERTLVRYTSQVRRRFMVHF